jgi:hypothetical protein
MTKFTQNGTYTCKFVEISTNDISDSIPYRESALYHIFKYCKDISVAKIIFSDDTIIVSSEDYPNFNNHIYTYDKYAKSSYLCKDNGTIFYVIPIKIHKLDKPNVTNMTIPLTCKVYDLVGIGHTHYKGDYGLNIVLGNETYHIERIIARNIINALGYNIVDENELYYEHIDTCNIELITNLPMAIYDEISSLESAERRDQENKPSTRLTICDKSS